MYLCDLKAVDSSHWHYLQNWKAVLFAFYFRGQMQSQLISSKTVLQRYECFVKEHIKWNSVIASFERTKTS